MNFVAKVLTFISLSSSLVGETWAFALEKTSTFNPFPQRPNPEISTTPSPIFFTTSGPKIRIDLDAPLEKAVELGASVGWNATKAKALVKKMTDDCSILEQFYFASGYEDWLMLSNYNDVALVSIRIPFALAEKGVAVLIDRLAPNELVIVNLTSYDEKNLRASPKILKNTVLPDGWDNFSTKKFSACDLFAIS